MQWKGVLKTSTRSEECGDLEETESTEQTSVYRKHRVSTTEYWKCVLKMCIECLVQCVRWKGVLKTSTGSEECGDLEETESTEQTSVYYKHWVPTTEYRKCVLEMCAKC